MLADALTALSNGAVLDARDHLVALYLCRVFSYWEEIEHLRTPEAIDALLDAQTSEVVAAVAERDLSFATAPPMAFQDGSWSAVGM